MSVHYSNGIFFAKICYLYEIGWPLNSNSMSKDIKHDLILK